MRPIPIEVVVAASVLHSLWRHVLEHPGREACGILVGTWGPPAVVDGAVPGINMLDASDQYMLDAASLLAADAAASIRGATIIGFYHSHPDHRPIPSISDRQGAWPGFIYLIVGTGNEPARATCVWSMDDRRRAHPVLLRVETATPNTAR